MGDGLGDGEGWTSPVASVRYAACKLWQESQADDSGLTSLGKVKRDCPAYYVDLELGNTPRRGTPTNIGSIPPGRRLSKLFELAASRDDRTRGMFKDLQWMARLLRQHQAGAASSLPESERNTCGG